jgi:arabinose-5-phosphate isomerase
MLTGASVPHVPEGTTMEDAVEEINRSGLGMTIVISSDDILVGIITDGDLRRLIARKKSIIDLSVEDAMTKNPRTVGPNSPAYDALNMMEQYQITVLPITDSTGKVLGILHLHEILGKGDFKFNSKL